METISSIKDEKIVLARAVKTSAGRDKYKKMLLEGEQIIDWALNNQVPIDFIFIVKDSDPALVKKYESQGIKNYEISAGVQRKISERKYLIPVIGVGSFSTDRIPVNDSFILVLDNVKDFGNIGTIIRSCNAFGIKHVLSTSKDLDLFHKKTIESSRGRVFSTKLEKFRTGKETIEVLRERGYQIVATSPRGNSIQSLIELEKKPVALVVGNESEGVSREIEDMADNLIQIPMSSEIESLNVGVAAGISLYELKIKQVMTMIEEKIKATLGRELNVAGMLVQKALDTALSKVSDIDSERLIFMMVLKCDNEMSLENMCRQFGILPSEINAFLNPLINKGFVIQNKSLKLTGKGEDVLSKLWFIIEETEAQILTDFSKDEANKLKSNLYQIQQRCIKIIAEGNKDPD